MFGSLGFPEILLILVLALLIFGPKRLPEVGRTIGKGLSEFRRASTDLKRTVNAELALDEDERPATSRRPEVGPATAEPSDRSSGAAPAAAPAATAPRPADGETAEPPVGGESSATPAVDEPEVEDEAATTTH